MDVLDVRIMRAYFQDRTLSPLAASFRDSVATIAKRVGEDEDTVRYRLRKILESGFIEDWRLFLNPHLWGGGYASVWFRVDPHSAKSEVVSKLRIVPGITHATLCYDRIIAFFGYDDEHSLPRQVELVRRLVGASDVFVAKDLFPECRATLTAREWDLIRALRRTPRKSYAQLASEIGISSRTARVKLSKLTGEAAVFEWPMLNLRAAPRGVFIHLFVQYPWERKDEVDSAIAAHLEPYHWHTYHMLPYRPGDPTPCGYDLVMPNLSVARQILEWTKGVAGVETAEVLLYEDLVSYLDVYDVDLDQRLSRMPTRTPKVQLRRIPAEDAPLEHA